MRAPATLRTQMESAVERLLAALDSMDGDPDLEGGADDELTLGAHEGPAGTAWIAPSDDREPSLGSTNEDHDQRRWADHFTPDGALTASFDREEQCEDEGGACEDEGGQCDDEGDVESGEGPDDDWVVRSFIQGAA